MVRKRAASAKRKRIPAVIRDRLLFESRRRCCLCFGLNKDFEQKRVQIAHIDRDRERSGYDDLVVLCLPHHDEYDQRTRQSQSMTPGEVKKYKDRLTKFIERWQEGPYPFLPPGFRSAFDLNAQIQRGRRRVQRGRAASDAYRVDVIQVADIRWKVVVIERSRDAWRTYAQLEFGGIDRKPSVQAVRSTGNPVVVVDHAGMRGTGVSERLSTWYVARAGSLVPILEYPTDGYVVGWGMVFDRHIRARVTRSPEVLAEGATLEVAFHVEYRASDPSGDSESRLLFVVQRRLVVAWDEGAELFVPTPTSDLGVEDVGSFMGDASDQFLLRYRDELLRLAASEDPRDKAFVLRLLDACSPGEAVDEVRRAVNSGAVKESG